MFEKETIARVSYLTVIGFLIACIVVAAYLVADYRGEIRTANVIVDYTESKNESLKDSLEACMGYIEYYRQMFARGFMAPKDGMVFLEEGTLIIPPESPQVEVETESAL